MRVLTVLAFLVLAFFALTEPCYANPIAYNPFYEISWTAFAILLIAAPFVEAWIIIRIVRDRVKPSHTLSRLFWALVLMNVITFIATQVLAYYIAIWSRVHMLGYLAEILPLIVEYLLLRWILTGLHRSGMFPKPFSNKDVIRMTVLANLVTFVAGLVFILALNSTLGTGLTPWPW